MVERKDMPRRPGEREPSLPLSHKFVGDLEAARVIFTECLTLPKNEGQTVTHTIKIGEKTKTVTITYIKLPRWESPSGKPDFIYKID